MSRAPRQKKTSYRPPTQQATLSEMLFGPEAEDDELVYGLLVTSLEHRDNRLLSQLKGVTDRSIIFQRLYTLDYEKSIIPFTSDPNPLGDIRAQGVLLVVDDLSWGPNLLEKSTGGEDENPHYWRIIEAAQDLAKVVVFIFIKGHKESQDYDGVIHPKFLNIAKGPWPRKAPYVVLLSYNQRLNKAQYDFVRYCLESEDNHVQIRIEFKNQIAASKEYQNRQAAEFAAAAKENESLTTKPVSEDQGKGKEKEKEHETDHKVHSSKEESFADLKAQLRKENEKQWSVFRAEFAELRAQVNQLKKELKQKDDEIQALKASVGGGANSSKPSEPAKPPADGNLLH